MNKYALITGGASGLGIELAKLFAKEGINLYLVSSNPNNLKAAKEELEKDYKVEVETLALDLSNPANFPKVREYSTSKNLDIEYLVNCAGFGDQKDFKDMDIDLQLKMIELNCNCPMYLMRDYVNDFLAKNSGHILNIASLASFFPGPFMSTYHASKAFLLNISEAINRELKGTNVHVTTVCPGPFTSGFVARAHNDYVFKKNKPISAYKVATISMKAMKKNKAVTVIGFKNKLAVFASRFFSRNFLVNISAKTLKEHGK